MNRLDSGRDALETSRYLVQEFEHTRARHGGIVEYAAPIFEMTHSALLRALQRAKQRGFTVDFHERADWAR